MAFFQKKGGCCRKFVRWLTLAGAIFLSLDWSPTIILFATPQQLPQRQAPAKRKKKSDGSKASSTPHTSEKKRTPGIQDNSFLVEEAYNQEYGVVQHINSLLRTWKNKDWIYTFTQEWPVDARPKHQLSYTIPVLHSGSFAGTGLGIGDIALNYRYQLVGNGESRVAIAPRFSVMLAAGSSAKGRGAGGTGLQTSFPLSLVLSDKLVTHFNAGFTAVRSAKNERGEKAGVSGYNLGHSIIWLAHPRVNVMLETVWNSMESVVGPGRTSRTNSLFISPGIRWAYNFTNGLQIVPGIGVPIGVGPSAGQRGLFIYLSFEHPFTGLKK